MRGEHRFVAKLETRDGRIVGHRDTLFFVVAEKVYSHVNKTDLPEVRFNDIYRSSFARFARCADYLLLPPAIFS